MAFFRINPRAARNNPFAQILESIGRDTDDLVQRAVVESVSGAELYLIRGGQTTRDERTYPANPDVTYNVGDEVILLRVRTGYAVICRMGRN